VILLVRPLCMRRAKDLSISHSRIVVVHLSKDMAMLGLVDNGVGSTFRFMNVRGVQNKYLERN
jgi:hypothetical protein